MPKPTSEYHSTESELAYLRKVGEWRSEVKLSKEEREHYLWLYWQGTLERKEWGEIDREVVLEYVKKELGEEVE